MSRTSTGGKSDEEVLRNRARMLAAEPIDTGVAGGSLEVIEFELAQERYAVETAYVREVHWLEDLTPLPGTPPFVAGIVNVRGRILAVIDIKRFFDLPDEGITDAHRIMVVQGEGIEIGILADSVVGLKTIPLSSIQGHLSTLTGVREEFLQGVTAERVVILDAPRILGDKRIVVQEEVT